MKISTFNLFQFCNIDFSFYSKKEKYTTDDWLKKTTWLKDKIINLNSDLIVFQEVFSSNDLEDICKECGFEHFIVVDKPVLEKNTFQTCVVAVASKSPIKEVYEIKTNNNFSFARKPIKIKVQIEEKEIIIYGVHLKSNRLNEFEHKFTINNSFKEKYQKNINNLENLTSALYQRFNEVKYLSEDINKTIKTEKNIIIAGDFNDKLHSFCIDILKYNDFLNDILQKNEIKNKYENQLFDAFDFANKKNRKYTSYFLSAGNIIDYILVSKNLTNIIDYDVDDFHLKDNKNGSLLNSDHAIVSCSIDLK